MAINAIYIRADSSAMNETGDEDDNKSEGTNRKSNDRGLVPWSNLV